jgi:hypothetical protein
MTTETNPSCQWCDESHDGGPEICAKHEAMQSLVDAAYAILNVEGPAKAAATHLGAWKGLDVGYHFDKVRAALKLAQAAGYPFRP